MFLFDFSDFQQKLTGTSSVDNLTGGTGSDLIQGMGGNDNLNGRGGNDVLDGSTGNDTLTGGTGSDLLTGGTGSDTFRFDSVGDDEIADFTSGSDKIRLVQSAIKCGDGDSIVERAVRMGDDDDDRFSTSAELVIMTHNISGDFTTAKAAQVIGRAASSYATGQTAVFVVDNGRDSAVYHFKSSGSDSTVSAAELTLVATVTGEDHTGTGDYLFGS